MGYREDLVSLAVGSMAESDSSSLIQIVPEASPGETIDKAACDIVLTSRGKRMTDRDPADFDVLKMKEHERILGKKMKFYLEFIYLQLVVDDYVLSFPRGSRADVELSKLFSYPVDEKGFVLDYSYLSTSDKSYYEKKRRLMITKKYKMCLAFLKVLEKSWFIEKEKYADVFKRLDAYGVVDEIEHDLLIAESVLSSTVEGLLKGGADGAMGLKYDVSVYNEAIGIHVREIFK